MNLKYFPTYTEKKVEREARKLKQVVGEGRGMGGEGVVVLFKLNRCVS